jgi:site-specific DNA recombinase
MTYANAAVSRAAMAERAASGIMPGCAPTGYRNASDASGRQWMEPDPVAGPLVLETFVLVDTGEHTLRGLASLIAGRGLRSRQGKVLGPGPLWYLLRSPFYAGYVRWGGKLIQGRHQPIVSRELFGRVQAKLGNGRKV